MLHSVCGCVCIGEFKECLVSYYIGGIKRYTVYVNIFEKTLRRLNKNDIVHKLQEQQEHRGTVATISKLFTENGFIINRYYEEKFDMQLLNGTAFLNHHFVKLGWLSSWKNIIPEAEWPVVFTQLEED